MTRAQVLFTLCIGLAGPALAQQSPGDGSSALVDDIAACRSVADTAARLACYDKAAAALQAARDRRELIVMNKETVRQTRRRLFGIALPQIKLFGDGVDEGETVESITAKVTSARRTDYARWSIKLDDGSTWTTLEDFRLRGPRTGDTLVIKRAAMGSFLGSLNGARSVRIMRVQ